MSKLAVDFPRERESIIRLNMATLESTTEKKENYGGNIIFGCSAKDWDKTAVLALNFVPGEMEDLMTGGDVEIAFAGHNNYHHQGKAKLVILEINLVPELKQKLIAAGHISE